MVNYDKDIDRTEESPTMAQRDRDGHNRSLRRSKMLLGQQINIYNDTERRIHWAQRGIFVFALLATAFYLSQSVPFPYTLEYLTNLLLGQTSTAHIHSQGCFHRS